MIPPLQSLVKYDNPVLVSTSKDKGKGAKGTLAKKARPDTRPHVPTSLSQREAQKLRRTTL